MQYRAGVRTLACCLGLSMVAGMGHMIAQAQQKAAANGKSYKSENAANVDLAEINLPAKVSVSRLTLDSGVAMGVHKHDGRSSIVTVVQGTLTEHRGDAVKVYQQGDVFVVPNGTTHYNESTGTLPLIYVEVNISPNAPATAPTSAAK